MFKSKKIKHIEKVMYSCKTNSQLLNANMWLLKLINNNIITDNQYLKLYLKSSIDRKKFLQDQEEYQRRLNSV